MRFAPLSPSGSINSARSRFAFTGTGALWIAYRDEWAGIARVYLDGELRGSVDTYAAPHDAQAAVFAVDALAPGAHVLEVEATGTRNLLSGGSWVWVDAFEAVARQEQDAEAVSLGGAWTTVPLGAHSGGSQVTYSMSGAVAGAAQEARRKLLDLAADHFEASPDDIELKNGQAQVKGVPDRVISLGELVNIAQTKAGGPGPVVGQGSAALKK